MEIHITNVCFLPFEEEKNGPFIIESWRKISVQSFGGSIAPFLKKNYDRNFVIYKKGIDQSIYRGMRNEIKEIWWGVVPKVDKSRTCERASDKLKSSTGGGATDTNTEQFN